MLRLWLMVAQAAALQFTDSGQWLVDQFDETYDGSACLVCDLTVAPFEIAVKLPIFEKTLVQFV